MIDLHIHTNSSADGQHSPAEILEMASRISITALSFTDHDAAGALADGEELSEEFGIEFIPGIELNTTHEGLDLHLLGYHMDWRSPDFGSWMDIIRKEKERQAEEIVHKFASLGFTIDPEKVRGHARGAIPTGSCFLLAMLDEPANHGDDRLALYRPGGARSESPFLNFYLDWLAAGRHAFVPLPGLPTADAITRLRNLGGVPVLGHPSTLDVRVVDELIEAGLLGIEALSTYHDSGRIEHWLSVAAARSLLVTAGSDFHGRRFKPDIALGKVRGNDESLLGPLAEAAARLRGQ